MLGIGLGQGADALHTPIQPGDPPPGPGGMFPTRQERERRRWDDYEPVAGDVASVGALDRWGDPGD